MARVLVFIALLCALAGCGGGSTDAAPAPAAVPVTVSGKVTFDWGSGTHDGIHAVALQPDGKIVVAGPTNAYGGGTYMKIGLARLTTAGALDTTFGCAAGTWALISQADAAFAGSSAAAILAASSALDAYNNSGDAEPIPSSLGPQGKATPKDSKALANRVFWNSP